MQTYSMITIVPKETIPWRQSLRFYLTFLILYPTILVQRIKKHNLLEFVRNIYVYVERLNRYQPDKLENAKGLIKEEQAKHSLRNREMICDAFHMGLERRTNKTSTSIDFCKELSLVSDDVPLAWQQTLDTLAYTLDVADIDDFDVERIKDIYFLIGDARHKQIRFGRNTMAYGIDNANHD